jgi:hypothetical protein
MDERSSRRELVEHLNSHVTYPATKRQIVEACSNMAHVPREDREWFERSLPEKIYKNAQEVSRALKLK